MLSLTMATVVLLCGSKRLGRSRRGEGGYIFLSRVETVNRGLQTANVTFLTDWVGFYPETSLTRPCIGLIRGMQLVLALYLKN